MKVANTYTFIISKNYGHPVTWSLPAGRVHLALALGALLVGALVTLSLLYLVNYPRIDWLERERTRLLRESEALRDQTLAANQDAFDEKGRRGGAGPAALVAEQNEPAWRDPGGEDTRYVPPIRIASVSTRVERRDVSVVFRMQSEGDETRNRGGFLFAIFENRDKSPTIFTPTPAVKTNEEGFPQIYKAGVRFPRIRGGLTYRRRVRRDSPEDYFTHVTLYLFSLRGGLLLKDRFELDREAFLQPGPVVLVHREPSA